MPELVDGQLVERAMAQRADAVAARIVWILLIKVREYLEAGVPWIWVVNPDDRTIQTDRAGGAGALLRPNDLLDGSETLPGFQGPVAAPFE